MLWHLPIKIPITHRKLLKRLRSTGKQCAETLGWREPGASVRKHQDLPARPQHGLGLWFPSLYFCPTSIPAWSAFCPALISLRPLLQKSVHFVSSSSMAKGVVFTFPFHSLSFFCQIFPSCSNRNSWRGKKKNMSYFSRYGINSRLPSIHVKGFLLGPDCGTLHTTVSILSTIIQVWYFEYRLTKNVWSYAKMVHC